MPHSPLRDSEGAVHLSIRSDGKPIADSIAVRSVQVHRGVNRVPTARLVIAEGDLGDGTWPAADGPAFQPGARISIAAGYGNAPAHALFEGVVAKLGLQINADQGSRVVVDCCHAAVRMTEGRKSAHHADVSDSALIRRIVQGQALDAEVDATGETIPALTQYDCSDWDFIVARAQANGLVVIADNDRIRVQAPHNAEAPVLRVEYGNDLIALQAEVDGLRGHMKFAGSAKAKVGSLIALAGVGARFSGEVFVAAVEHEVVEGDWVTTAEFGLPPQWKDDARGAVAPAAANRLPAADGLHIGIVVRLDGDPAAEQRIQVRLPELQATQDTVWARVLQFHASSRFGAFFMPEVGDEVIVAFSHHDPSHPVVLGSLYSRRHPPPHALDPANDIKAMVTRCGHRLQFDEKHKAITVTTPADNQVVLSDTDRSIVLKDQNGNRVELHPGGIIIRTPKDLTIAADGAISIEALGSMSMGSKADLTCSGLNVRCDAQASFSGKGLASAELSAAGQTLVKGAIVLIN